MINGIDRNADFSMLNRVQMRALREYMNTWEHYLHVNCDNKLTDAVEQERVVARIEGILKEEYKKIPMFPDHRLVPTCW